MLQPDILRQAADTLEWPEVRLAGPRRLVLAAEYVVEWEAAGFPRQRLIVPRDFECDGASIPAPLEWYLGRDLILPAAVPHDWQYAFAGVLPAESHLYLTPEGAWLPANYVWTRDESDRFFSRNLRFCAVRSDQRRNAYRAVRIGGWIAWQRARRRNSRQSPAPA